MGIFDSIKEKILGKKEEPAPAAAPAASSSGGGLSFSSIAAAAAAKAGQPDAKTPESLTAAAKAAVAKVIDVEAVVEEKVKAKGIKLNWRESIVDLLKALDLDSSLAARKELAADLKYDGPHADGSAEKNIWLHKAVMKALAENGGVVPKDLLK